MATASALATTVEKPSIEASSRIVADSAPVPKSVVVAVAEIVEKPRSWNSAVPVAKPGLHVVKDATLDSPDTLNELLTTTFA